LLLTLRLQIEFIFRVTYKTFFENVGPSGNPNYAGQGTALGEGEEVQHVQRALRNMQGFITELLDPNLYFSRLSFLESSKEAIDIKFELSKGKAVGRNNFKLPSITRLFNTRSPLVANLFEVPTDGSMRMRFSDNLSNFKASLNQT